MKRNTGSLLLPTCAAAVLAAMPASTAYAHTAYMLPNVFVANLEQQITVQSSFAEDFFRPEVAVDSDDWHVVLPDGSRGEFENVAQHRQIVILESPIEAEGTYRFTSGVRHGRKSTQALVNGEWETVRGDEIPAEATETRTSQTETVSDVYVSKKAPTRAPVDVRIGRLLVQPLTHPSDVYLDSEFELAVLFDGQPMAGHAVSIDRSGSEYDEEKFHEEITTGEDGRLSLSFDQPGIYVLMTRHRADAPDGAESDIRSYTTSLTFEVQR
ncbi:DUF4198 domain-containing protein [Alteraurantiacibacter aquimixticola]|uniref:DUF4198 domain-containing protein n=1 Tax=Alteraurantiacibacter aquimixticola TaxID=2489173 RepID=A0A4T3F3B5_9SPHN|nr:DUF4198 domain-containing protein [Alteraurantiacibacter aquimixticola]TIX51693.1 DUF4198 domain-containing protein [Alteraurantiacibacter aquimixticola]